MEAEKVSDGDDEAEMWATRWKIDVGQKDPEVYLVEIIAELEQTSVNSLPPVYETIGSLVEQLFSDPPPAEAQAMLQFSYHGYRIDLEQSGVATIMKVTRDG